MIVDGSILVASLRDRSNDDLGVIFTWVGDADALRRRLVEQWDVRLVAVDLALVDAELLEQLQRAGSPDAIFLVDEARGADAITLAANVRDYLRSDVGPEELAAAIRRVLEVPRAPAQVGDFSDRDSARLNALGAEVGRIARALSEIATAQRDDAADTAAVTGPFVRAIIKRRRERERFFPAELFSDPAWDMLLDLTAARLERRLVSVSSLCIAAAVPTTTALRWIRNLCELGLFVRDTDPDDARRGLISLVPDAAKRMLGYLAATRGGALI